MLIRYLLQKNFFELYSKYSEESTFQNSQHFFINLANVLNKVLQTHDLSKIDPQIIYFLSQVDPDKKFIKLPFIFSSSRESLISRISDHFLLNSLEEENLRELIFNFCIKNFIENEFGHKFVRWALVLMENRINDLKGFEKSQKDSLAKLSQGTTAPIHELEPVFLNFINFQLQNYPEFKYLKNTEELINRKKEFFPEIFTTGKPKTIAFNELVYGLYLLITERNSNYMPFIKYVVDELNQINPKYFERNNISVEALRKKVKDQIKLNSK